MRKMLATWGACALMMLGLSGCFYQDLEVLSVEDFSEVRLSLDGMQAQMKVDVYNPNLFAVSVKDANVTLFVNEEEVGDLILLEGQDIRPESRATVSLKVSTREGSLGKVLKNDLMSLLRGAEVPFAVRGTVTAKAFGLSFKVPLKHNQSMNIRP